MVYTLNNGVRFELFKLVDQNPLRDIAKLISQLAVAQTSVNQLPDNCDFPFSADNAHGVGNVALIGVG
jgi:hypothetical protein